MDEKIIILHELFSCPRCGGAVFEAEKVLAKGRVRNFNFMLKINELVHD